MEAAIDVSFAALGPASFGLSDALAGVAKESTKVAATEMATQMTGKGGDAISSYGQESFRNTLKNIIYPKIFESQLPEKVKSRLRDEMTTLSHSTRFDIWWRTERVYFLRYFVFEVVFPTARVLPARMPARIRDGVSCPSGSVTSTSVYPCPIMLGS